MEIILSFELPLQQGQLEAKWQDWHHESFAELQHTFENYLEKGPYSGRFRVSVEPEHLTKLITWLRKYRKLTQQQLAERIGYPKAVMGNIEQGSRKLGLKTLNDLIDALEGKMRIEVSASINPST